MFFSTMMNLSLILLNIIYEWSNFYSQQNGGSQSACSESGGSQSTGSKSAGSQSQESRAGPNTVIQVSHGYLRPHF